MNAVTNAQVWHRCLGHLNKHSLKLMIRKNGNGVALDGSMADCDVCAVGQNHQLAHRNEPTTPPIMRPFSLCTEISWAPSNRRLMVDTSLSARAPTSSLSGPQSTFSAATIKPLPRFSCSVTSTVIPLGKHINRWRADKEATFNGDEFKNYCRGTGITQEFAATNTPLQIGVSERARRTLCGMVRCMLVDRRLRPFLLGELMRAASYLRNRIPHSAPNMETPHKMLGGKSAHLSHLRIIGARAFVHIKDANKPGHTSWKGMVCGCSQNERATPSVFGTPRRVELSKAGTSSSSKRHRTCFRFPGGFRR